MTTMAAPAQAPEVHIQTVDKVVKVPQVQTQEVVKHVPKVQIQTVEKVVEVPEFQTREVTREVPVPVIQKVEKIVEVPQIQTQEMVKHVPKVVKQVVEKVVEVPQVQTQEVVKHVPVPVHVEGPQMGQGMFYEAHAPQMMQQVMVPQTQMQMGVTMVPQVVGYGFVQGQEQQQFGQGMSYGPPMGFGQQQASGGGFIERIHR